MVFFSFFLIDSGHALAPELGSNNSEERRKCYTYNSLLSLVTCPILVVEVGGLKDSRSIL